LKILFYGRLAELIAPELALPAQDGCSVAELRHRLAFDYPEAGETLANLRSRAVVGTAVVGEDYRVGSGDRLEFLSPVSGG
jgi:molybdopterin converting factor small subunit